MGNSFSQAATEQKKQEVNNVIADIMNCFLLRFIAHYKNRIICRYIGSADRFRKNAEAKQLSVCPPIDIPLITGIIGKQREWLKSWANRAVVICNEADNFRIDYYLPQLPVSKRTYRGSIYPVGYYIEAFLSDSEAAKMKDMHCIKLSSLSSNKRPWYLRFETEEECALWHKMLSKATSESKSALNATSPHENRSKKQLSASANQSNKEYEGVDPAVLCVDDAGPTDTYISRAYYYAYRDVRLRYGLCGDFKIVGDEVEALAELTTSIVGYEVTNNICNSITDAGLRETVTSSVKNNINVLANSLAKHTWHNASTTAQALRHSTEKQVKHIVLPLKQQKKIIYENIVESVDSLVRQFVSEAVAKICKPFLVSASVPVAKAYAAAVQSWYKYVVQTIERNKEEYFAMDGDGGGGVSSSFSAFVDKMHIDLDCEWVSMFGDKQNLNFNDPQVTNAKSPASMTPDSQSDPPVERRETVSSCVNNAIMTRCNPEHVLHESKSVLALLREYNGPFDKIQHVFSASFTAKDVVNCIEKQIRAQCHNALFTLRAQMNHKLRRASSAKGGLSPVRRPVSSNSHGRNDSTSYAPSAAFTLLRKQSGTSSSAIMASNQRKDESDSTSFEGVNPTPSLAPVVKSMELQVVDDIMSRFMHDAMIAHHETLFMLLLGMLQPSIESSCIIPCVDLITPIREMIAVINVPGVANNMDLEILLEGVILDIVHDSIKKMIQESVYLDVRREMDKLASDLSLVYAFVPSPVAVGSATQTQPFAPCGTSAKSATL